MNESDLDRKLKAARVPGRPDEYWENFPQQVLVRLRSARASRPADRRWRPRLAWGFGLAFGLAFAGLAIGFVVGQWHQRTQNGDRYSLVANRKVLSEVMAMFPNRVKAIVQDEHGMQLMLSDRADVPASTPIWIKVCDGNQCRTVVTFSGQELQIAREKVEVLADAQGRVLLVGDQLFWSSADPDRTTGRLRIRARPLAYAL